jgi:type IV pilus biogenesis protein CpaD/CtpE
MSHSSNSLPLRFCLAAALLLVSTGADPAPQGQVIVAKTQNNGIVLWDITPAVATIVAAPDSKDAKIHSLELKAGRILLDHLAEMSAASTVEVRVFYQETGAVSDVYRVNTFGGIAKVFTVIANVTAASRNKAAWETQIAGGVLPAGMAVRNEGELPAR